MNASSIDEARRGLDKALALIREARFSELAAHAEGMNRHVEALEQLKAEIDLAGAEGASPEIGSACEQLKEHLHLVSEVLRHGSMVECGLREVELAFTTSYSERGYPANAGNTRLSAEA